MKSFFPLFALLLLALAACKKEKPDITKPKITLHAPTHKQVFKPGETLRVEASFTDNIELSEYIIDIHNAAGHGHGRITGEEWKVLHTGKIAGTMDKINQNFPIPGMDSATYDVLVQCIDKAGNEADFAFVQIVIVP